MDIADVLERLEAALIKPVSVLCSWSFRVEDRMACRYLALFKSFDEQLPSKFPTDSRVRVCVCARTRECVCMRVCVRVCFKQHFRMIEMFKRTLPSELFVGLTFRYVVLP